MFSPSRVFLDVQLSLLLLAASAASAYLTAVLLFILTSPSILMVGCLLLGASKLIIIAYEKEAVL
jgi:hypothetical protein